MLDLIKASPIFSVMGESMMPIIAKEKNITIQNFWESHYNKRYPSMQDLPSPWIYISRKLPNNTHQRKTVPNVMGL
jgi:hypothetical protein